ncbi:MAG: hypothetical protein JWO06_2973 [Bacteroidota bacterium]|nr:hypothetical protein [Bacteroidota bacterium]
MAYLNNDLSAEEKQELEKLLKDDPFAQDALEGLQSAQNNAAVLSSISTINKKVRERSGLKEHTRSLNIHWSNYAWAAVVLGLLIGIGFVMIGYLGKTNKDNLAMADKKKVTMTEQPILIQEKSEDLESKPELRNAVADSTVSGPKGTVSFEWQQKANEGANIANDDKKQVLSQPFTIAKKDAQNAGTDDLARAKSNGNMAAGSTITLQGTSQGLVNTKSPVMNSTIVANNENGSILSSDKNAYHPATLKEEALNDRDNWKGDPKSGYYGRTSADSISVISGNATRVEYASSKSKAERKEADKIVDMDEAMKNFNNREYEKASTDFDKILSHDPDNADALYYGGISDYIDGKSTKSEKNFDKLIKKGSKFADGAKWYKANILIKKGEITAGKNLLQELTSTSGSYKERAVKKIAELGF